jgi:DNA-binding NarL/FixJ family response regulator
VALRVFHADDSEMYRFLVREALGDGEIVVVGQAAETAELLAGVRDAQPDVVLLDQLGGAEIVDAVRDAAPGARVIVLSGHLPEDGDRAFAERADGYIVKGADLDELRRAVRG